MVACYKGHYNLIQRILKLGADVNARSGLSEEGTHWNAMGIAIKCLKECTFVTKHKKGSPKFYSKLNKYIGQCTNIISMWTHLINHKHIDLNAVVDSSSGMTPLMAIASVCKTNSCTTTHVCQLHCINH